MRRADQKLRHNCEAEHDEQKQAKTASTPTETSGSWSFGASNSDSVR
jgi:hypothetical protein